MTVGEETLSATLDIRIPVDRLVEFTASAFRACGVPSDQALTVSTLMVEADLTGAAAHGVFRLPDYIRSLQSGLFNPAAAIAAERRGLSVALIDGDNGLGHLAAKEASRLCIEMATETGIGWAGVHSSNHSGSGSIYAAMPASHGMIGIYAAVAAANHMAPWGGSEALMGTNPLAIAVPASDGACFMLDMATSVASFGAIKNHAFRGEPLPEGWMIDRRTGMSLIDPSRLTEGLLAPLGGHKGSGLAIAIGLLAGVLNGAGFGRDMRNFDEPAVKPANVGQMVIAVDPSRFMPRDMFEREVARHLADIANVRPLPNVAQVRWPGERRHLLRAEVLASGVSLAEGMRQRLNALAGELQIQPLESTD
jgi:LDH2 family malate/lactate/ureidoglycolate dehydrogenase